MLFEQLQKVSSWKYLHVLQCFQINFHLYLGSFCCCWCLFFLSFFPFSSLFFFPFAPVCLLCFHLLPVYYSIHTQISPVHSPPYRQPLDLKPISQQLITEDGQRISVDVNLRLISPTIGVEPEVEGYGRQPMGNQRHTGQQYPVENMPNGQVCVVEGRVCTVVFILAGSTSAPHLFAWLHPIKCWTSVLTVFTCFSKLTKGGTLLLSAFYSTGSSCIRSLYKDFFT